MDDILKRYVSDFRSAIEPLRDAYRNNTFSYFAVKTPDGPVLIRGFVYLNVQKPTIPFGTFESNTVVAGHFDLSDLRLSPDDIIEQLLCGAVGTPQGKILFPTNPNGGHYGVQYQPYHEIGLRAQRRMIHLAILGAESHHFLEQTKLDWELRGASTPYDGIQDLLNEFQPGELRGVNCVEIAAFPVVMVDPETTISENTASIKLQASISADTHKVAVGIRVIEQGRTIRREQLAGDAITWGEKGSTQRGAVTFHVPRAAVVQAFATYNRVVQQHCFFTDANSFLNPRRAAYEAFDPKLAEFNAILSKSRESRPDARDFEAAMPWLFWMLGFSPAHIGGLPRTRDAADFLMATPSGNLAVVECTVGLLKDDNKLPRLHDRIQAVRRKLDTPGMRHIRILPVIITAKSAEEVRPDIEQAEKLGIHVITREIIDKLVLQTLTPVNADQVYEHAEQATKSAKDAREAQQSLLV